MKFFETIDIEKTGRLKKEDIIAYFEAFNAACTDETLI
jgi:hypothetical protein